MMRRAVVVALLAFGAIGARAQTSLSEFRTPQDQVLLGRLLRAEDNRARGDGDLATLRQGLGATNPALRRMAVRGLGRLERSNVLADITPLLADRDARVRAAAADAMAQGASHGGGPVARTALGERLTAEQDPVVVAMVAESYGRLPPADAQDAANAATALERLSRNAPAATLRGVARALFFLTRKPEARGAMPAPVIERLRQLASRDRDAYIRAVASAALLATGGATAADVEAMLTDPDESVREKAVPRISAVPDTASARRQLARALSDPAPIVRFRAVPVYTRLLRAADGCAPLVHAARDTNTHVALAAIDAVSGCRDDAAARALLDSLAGQLTRSPAQWHRPAHALVSLAALAPDAARRHLPAFVSSGDFFVRTYAAQAARRLGDASTLLRLAGDAHANVRVDAIDALSASVGHDYDQTYITALESTDSQLLQSAARALRGGKNPAAPAALLASLDRITALRRETSRDARVALLATIRSAADSTMAGRLRPYLRDFDPVVADSAANILATWTGTRPTVAVASLPPVPLPPTSALRDLLDPRATIEMADGSKVVLRLFPLDAPTNTWRFIRLARAGYFEGLTFHRVVPWFVVQGGSPGANEYVGDGPFTRDEVGMENQRGTIGVSTRGRDTGDGQIYFNTVDNVRLDHDYTVFAAVVSGMEAVDRMQEGAKIRRITVR